MTAIAPVTTPRPGEFINPAALMAIPIQTALALMWGGIGNERVRDPGWPAAGSGPGRPG